MIEGGGGGTGTGTDWTAIVLGFAGHDVCIHVCCSVRKVMEDERRHGRGSVLAQEGKGIWGWIWFIIGRLLCLLGI